MALTLDFMYLCSLWSESAMTVTMWIEGIRNAGKKSIVFAAANIELMLQMDPPKEILVKYTNYWGEKGSAHWLSRIQQFAGL